MPWAGKKGAILLAIACFTLGPWTDCVQTESVVGAMQEGFGLDPRISVAVLGVTCFATIFGGLKRISAVMEKIVPFMALLYILGGMGDSFDPSGRCAQGFLAHP